MACLIMTDLDGTLLDDGYPYDSAVRALDTLAQAYPDVRIALASSKTAREMVGLASRCRRPPLLVFENGAGIAWQVGSRNARARLRRGTYEIAWRGPDYRHIRRVLNSLRAEEGYRFEGFGDMRDSSVARQTGLDACAARAARHRLASEPIVWKDDHRRLIRFRADLKRRGLTMQSGGRFHHITANACKARALHELRQSASSPETDHITTIACGDAPNDLTMLEQADFAIAFPDAEGNFLLPEGPRVFHAAAPGPEVWLSTVEQVLNHQK